jgi:hypothetical protein
MYPLFGLAFIEFVLPLTLLTFGTWPFLTAYSWIAAAMTSALLAGRVGGRIATILGYERITLQLRSQRLLICAAGASLIFFVGILGPLRLSDVFVGHAVLAMVLGFVALGHTVVALGELAGAILKEELTPASL